MAFTKLSPKAAARDVRSDDQDGASPSKRRRVDNKISRRTGSRVAIGVLLITSSVVGLTYSFSSSAKLTPSAVLVPTIDIAPGQPLYPAEFRQVDLTIPPSLQGSFITDYSALSGKLSFVELRAEQPIQPQEITQAPPFADRVLTLEVPSAQAVEGSLTPGDRVDVLATYGTGPTATTITAGSDVLVMSVQSIQGSLATAGTRTVSVTLAAKTYIEAMAIAQAQVAAKVTLVRSTGSTPLVSDPIYPPGTSLTPLPTIQSTNSAGQLP